MKQFFNIKRIVFVTIISITLIALIFMLIFPIGLYPETRVTVYSPYEHKFITYMNTNEPLPTTSPFTIRHFRNDINWRLMPGDILLAQTIVFTIVAIVFVVFSVLFAIDLKRAGVFEKPLVRRPTKAERMQAQIDELQKQVDELKKGE